MKKTNKTKKSKLGLKTEKIRMLGSKELDDASGGMPCTIMGSVPHCGVDCNSSGG